MGRGSIPSGRTIAALATVAAVVTVSVMGGCSAVLGIESDRHVAAKDDASSALPPVVDGGSDAGNAAVRPGWECIDDVPPVPSPAPVQLKLFFNDVSTAASTNDFAGTPVPFASLRACGTLDLVCENPVGIATADDAGIAIITVPPQFRGYYEVSATGFTPSVLARPPQLLSEYAQQGLASLTLIALGGQLAGVTADPELGTAIVSVLDCVETPAAGMLIEVGEQGPGEKLVYLDKSLPSAGAKMTDATGSAIVYNVPPGTLTLAAKFADTGRVVRSISTIARGKWLTMVQMRVDQARISPIDGGPR